MKLRIGCSIDAALNRPNAWSALMILAEQTQGELLPKMTALVKAGARTDLLMSGVSALDLICSRSLVDPALRKCVQLLLSNAAGATHAANELESQETESQSSSATDVSRTRATRSRTVLASPALAPQSPSKKGAAKKATSSARPKSGNKKRPEGGESEKEIAQKHTGAPRASTDASTAPDRQRRLAASALIHLAVNYTKSTVWANICADLVKCIEWGDPQKERGSTWPLSVAVWVLAGLPSQPKHIKSLQNLLDKGAKADFQLFRNDQRMTSLSRAYCASNVEIVELLLSNGADPTASEFSPGGQLYTCTLARAVYTAGRSPSGISDLTLFAPFCTEPLPASCVSACFLELCLVQRIDPVEILSKFFGPPFNVDPVSHRDALGDSVLHTAISRGNVMMVSVLLQIPGLLAALWNTENYDGETPLSLALMSEHYFAFSIVGSPLIGYLISTASDDDIEEEFLSRAKELAQSLRCVKSGALLEELQSTRKQRKVQKRVRYKKRWSFYTDSYTGCAETRREGTTDSQHAKKKG
jgi:hypothetical protein